MRPPRIAILALFFAASVFLFCRSIIALRRSNPVVTTPVQPQQSQFRSLFSFAPIWSIFPPNAQISLTDDNNTFFPARPAGFGPPLPPKGLSGQLWIGSGFAEDNLQGGENQGELGCSDIPGWDGGPSILAIKTTKEALLRAPKLSSPASKPKNSKRDGPAHGPLVERSAKEARIPEKARVVDDGTDDYLHQGLQSTHKSLRDSASSDHADIQSIQETAEITGKVVLLKRGGCGFFEKVKWAQRRGATAVIVGDNTKGGPLIQMWARADTSNITIPSVFTAHTTAHLLSSLMQPGSFIEDIIDENGHAAQKVQQFDGGRKKAASTATNSKTATASKAKDQTTQNTGAKSDSHQIQRRTWLSRFFSWSSDSNTNTSRSPSKGRLNWVLVDEWNDEKDKMIKSSLEKASREGSGHGQPQTSGDGFQIGVQDWRDPDLVGGTAVDTVKVVDDKTDSMSTSKPKDLNSPKGGSITPGSGEYRGEGASNSGSTNAAGSIDQPGIISKIFGDDDNADSSPEPQAETVFIPGFADEIPDGGHEGLWVTLTPTSSASPFFDTLLVLVISPLITLSVVYALLILRARIRRRRWRAPKSVVEQLPVRTYHTVAASGSPSPRLPSPSSTSPTTPLLQQGGASRPRPRSRTTTGIPDAGDLLRVDSALANLSRPPSRAEREKDGNMPSSWKKYMGRQVECVVCLEEYVDGVSRVMSLPCGHEFHADCITPWLTTRRRTCPICKGDVVRSLARGVPSSPRYEAYQDDEDDDVRALQRRNSDRSTPQSPRDDDDDLEQGYTTPTPGGRTRRAATPGETWYSNIFSSSFGSVGSSSRMGRQTPPDEEDRTR